jgi:hypothetical protein
MNVRSFFALILLAFGAQSAHAQDWQKVDPMLHVLHSRIINTSTPPGSDIGELPSIKTGFSERYAVQGLKSYLAAGKNGKSPTVSVFIRIEEKQVINAVKQVGVQVDSELGNIITARLPVTLVPQLSEIKGVRSVGLSQRVHPQNMKSRR